MGHRLTAPERLSKVFGTVSWNGLPHAPDPSTRMWRNSAPKLEEPEGSKSGPCRRLSLPPVLITPEVLRAFQ